MHEALWDLEVGPAIAPEGAEPDEARLLAGLRDGNVEAFEALYRRLSRTLYGLAYRLACDREVAAELVQESFARAWQHRARFRNFEHLRRWLRRVTIHEWINQLRRSSHGDRRRDRAQPEAADAVAPTVPARAGLRLDLERALAQLTPRLRAVLLLFDLYGQTHQEIARSLRITVGASKVQLHRARTRLKEILG